MTDYLISVDIIGAKELKSAIDNVGGVARQAISDALNQTAYKVQAMATKYAPHLHGPLRDSIHVDQPPGHLAKVEGNNITAQVGTNIIYGHYQEMGGFGKRVVKRYTEPGTGKFFMKRAGEESKPLMTNFLQKAMERIVKSLVI